jgi:peptide deformylase
MVLPVVYAGHPALYKRCKEIPVKDIRSAKIQTFLNDLADTVKFHKLAAGFAAPQVAKELRVFCLDLDKASLTFTPITPKTFSITPHKPFFFINPKIEAIGHETDFMAEGCLSIPSYYVYLERALTIKVSAYTQDAEYFEIIATGLYARYIQHEYDHLDGILTFQRAKRTQDIVYQDYAADEEIID